MGGGEGVVVEVVERLDCLLRVERGVVTVVETFGFRMAKKLI